MEPPSGPPIRLLLLLTDVPKIFRVEDGGGALSSLDVVDTPAGGRGENRENREANEGL